MKNDAFTEAYVLAQEQWVETLSEQEEEHTFSRWFDRRMDRLYSKMRGDRYHHLSRASLSILVAAALIATLMIASVAYGPARRYLIEVFDDHTEFQTENSGLTSIPMDIQFGYIPSGFKLVEQEIDGATCVLSKEGGVGLVSDYHFEDDNGRWIDVSKYAAGGQLDTDSEDHSIEVISHNDTVYYLSFSEPDIYGVYWLESGIQYDLGGKLTRKEALKMAYQVR